MVLPRRESSEWCNGSDVRQLVKPPMIGQGYAAARMAAPRVWAHFARHLETAREHGRQVDTPLPDPLEMEAVIDAAFWASLRREEGYVPKISLAVLPPERTEHPLRFERPLPLLPAALAQ